MSDGEFSADAGSRRKVSRLDSWSEKTGTVFLSREDIQRLAEGETCCLIISLPCEEAAAAEAAAMRWRRLRRTTLHAIAVGTCIGASTGLSVASTFLVMTHKAPAGVVALIERALTLFA